MKAHTDYICKVNCDMTREKCLSINALKS